LRLGQRKIARSIYAKEAWFSGCLYEHAHFVTSLSSQPYHSFPCRQRSTIGVEGYRRRVE
jgi:hypothetical protein